jgi:hypothetical protein
MAIVDILGQPGDGQDFIVELPAGNTGYIANDVLVSDVGILMCNEIPAVTGGGSNIFIMSE